MILDAPLLAPTARLKRGLWISIALWMIFMVVTAYTSAATLLERVASNDVMKAATGGALSGKIAGQVAYFLLMQVALHLFFALLTWFLAIGTAILHPGFRVKVGRLVVGWFSLVAGATVVFNALWFPRTLIGAYYHEAVAQPLGPWPAGQWFYWVVASTCVAILSLAFARLVVAADAASRRRLLWSAAGLAVFVAATAAVSALGPGTASAAAAARPHVILLGIDSLRLEQLRRFGGTGVTPNLDAFLARADLFKDATTPAARTYPSWSAILSGRAPPVTGARFNLAERSTVHINPTIGDVLRSQGYRTVYSTDEVRFANIDETYGFDQVVTPRIGASDFMIGTYNELPLASLVINTWIGKLLFPFSYANRGVATMFLPETYLDRIRREVRFDGPTFFIAHLTAAHWPYYTGDVPFGVPDPSPSDERPLYRIGLQTADRMFGELMDVLREKGALNNALVVLLSDHGEALSLPSDSFFDTTFTVEGLKAPLKMLDYGHGQSVLSKSQYQVLLSFRTFGRPESIGASARTFDFPATVEDISPTLLDFLAVRGDPLKATGRSLLPIIRSGSDPSDVAERVRFTETDLSVLPAPGGGVDEQGTAQQNAKFFEVDPHTARLHIRAAYAELAIAYKERAAFTKNRLLAAIPAGPYAHQYLMFDFTRNHGWLLLGRPGDEDPDGRDLWDALNEHYRGELHRPVAVTPEDWVRIESEWQNFIQDQQARRLRPLTASR